LIGVAVAGVLVIDGSRAAFTDTTKNEGNTLDAGTVQLSDDSAGQKLFDVGDLNATRAGNRSR
jgi:predicted ribosomally synthesized peptide with SipW-like signal peptide